MARYALTYIINHTCFSRFYYHHQGTSTRILITYKHTQFGNMFTFCQYSCKSTLMMVIKATENVGD